MKFSEMQYERVDIKALSAAYEHLTAQVQTAENAETVFAAFTEHEKLYSHAETMITLTYIRHSIDTNDAFYEAENDFYDENSPLLTRVLVAFMQALLASPFLPQLKEKYGELMFVNAELENKAFKPEIVPLLQQENKLCSQYSKLVASAKIQFDGKELTLSELSPYKKSADRSVRKAAFEADAAFYKSHEAELDDIYDELISVRTKIANELGFDSFTKVAYLRLKRNCYDPAMVQKFRNAVKSDIVPLCGTLIEKQKQRIGIDELHYYDNDFLFPEGNPRPVGTAEDILAAGRKMYEEMSPETAEFVAELYDNELLDVLSRKGKQVGGYCTFLPDYKASFIFSNFNGTADDVEVLTHEAGHAFAGWLAKDFEVRENMDPTMESCECHSMSMDFFAWKWLELFYGDKTPTAKLAHLEGCIRFIPYGCMVDEFQHIVYDNPTLTKAQRHEVWEKLEQQYRPFCDRSDLAFYGEGRGWQRQHHIYELPFYYIDYCLAQTVALTFWALMNGNREDAWARYLAFAKLGGKKTFVDLCKTADVQSPFEDGVLAKIVAMAVDFLEN